ncbi:hypothetical protein GCM10020000_41270 [Streptomyces olivoverticillatus]
MNSSGPPTSKTTVEPGHAPRVLGHHPGQRAQQEVPGDDGRRRIQVPRHSQGPAQILLVHPHIERPYSQGPFEGLLAAAAQRPADRGPRGARLVAQLLGSA